jgi:hypothetical protein
MDIVVSAGNHDRVACPVWAQLPLQEGGAVPTVRLTDEGGAPVPCQLEPSGTGTEDRLWLTWVVRDLDAGQERRYRLEPAGEGEAPTDHGPGVVLEELPDGQLSVHIGGELFTTYYFGSDVVRPYMHPLIGPGGNAVTRRWPMEQKEGEPAPGERARHPYDHPHHKGFLFAHGDVNGADHWSEGPSHATMRHAGFQRLISGPVYGGFDETVEWLDRDGTRVIMAETRRVTFFNLGTDERLFDVSLRFNATSGTVTFGDTKEGGLISVRVASSMDAPAKNNPEGTGRIENSYGGVQMEETWGKRAMWCDYAGPVEGEIVGITMMDHPTNPRYPTHWHVRDYGLMTTNPFGLHDFYADSDTHRGDWTIPAYESRNFLYRVLIHRGGTADANVRERYHDFINLPAIKLG